MSVYDFTVKDYLKKDVSLEKYKGNVLLIVNTATHCGFTPTYKELEKLYLEFKNQGFEILDFPCNQFGNQAPEDILEINTICSRDHGTTFPRFDKIDVNGENASPLYKFLKDGHPFKGFKKDHPLTEILNGIISKENANDIKWNFTKFLINKKGEVVERFEPTADFETLEKAIKEELAK